MHGVDVSEDVNAGSLFDVVRPLRVVVGLTASTPFPGVLYEEATTGPFFDSADLVDQVSDALRAKTGEVLLVLPDPFSYVVIVCRLFESLPSRCQGKP
jgi:hypothetical protein